MKKGRTAKEKGIVRALDAAQYSPVSHPFRDFVETELGKLGVSGTRDRQAFYRGAIVAAIAAVKRSRTPAWRRFMAAVHPQARKHLGLELELELAKDVIKAGSLAARAGRGKVTLERYSPSQVSKADAREIDALLAKARKGELAFKKTDRVTVKPPKRAYSAGQT